MNKGLVALPEATRILLAACALALGVAASAMAAQDDVALKKDALCTRCHDESETEPVLSIYQTKHDVHGDARAPSCQSCHGESQKHLKGEPKAEVRPAPDMVFKKGVYEVSDDKDRAAQCLSCHKGGKRSRWDAAAHRANAVSCDSCHEIHRPADKVLARKKQTEVCFTCHRELSEDSQTLSMHPVEAGQGVCSDCHNPHS